MKSSAGKKTEFNASELSSSKMKLRLLIVLILVAVGGIAIGRAVYLSLHKEPGWYEIPASASKTMPTAADELVLMYNLGTGGNTASSDYRDLQEVYTLECQKAYALFDPTGPNENVSGNLGYINSNPNEDVEADPYLYKALEKILASGGREIYLGPLFNEYWQLIHASDEQSAADRDPQLSAEIRQYYEEIFAFANSAEDVELLLLGNNKVRLSVSDRYMKFAEENAIREYLGLGWMKNALVVDYVAGRITESGKTYGVLSSYDGYSRDLGTSGGLSHTLFAEEESGIVTVAQADLPDASAVVSYRDFITVAADSERFYVYSDGRTVHSYLFASRDVFSHSAAANLVCYSRQKDCLDIVLSTMAVYSGDSIDEAGQAELASLAKGGIHTAYCSGGSLFYTESGLSVRSLREAGEKEYKPVLLK